MTGATSTVLYCHGNAGNLSHRAERIRRWQSRLGHHILIFDYPGYGRSGGTPSEAGCYAAAKAAHRWLTDVQRIRPNQMILFGESLGCMVAVELARLVAYRALVLVSPFTSVPDMAKVLFPWLPVSRFVQNRFDSLVKIGALSRTDTDRSRGLRPDRPVQPREKAI